jgi:thioredoxin
MLRIFFTLALSALMCAVGYAQGGAKKSSIVVKQIGKEEFLQKVFNFEKSTWWKYEGIKPCIVNFHADWCGPCRTLEPILEDLAKKYEEQILVYKIDTEKEKDLCAAFGIKSLPTVLFCPLGGRPQVVAGALPYETIEKAIQDVLIKSIEDAKRPKKVGW